jgi:hypothetical protein
MNPSLTDTIHKSKRYQQCVSLRLNQLISTCSLGCLQCELHFTVWFKVAEGLIVFLVGYVVTLLHEFLNVI